MLFTNETKNNQQMLWTIFIQFRYFWAIFNHYVHIAKIVR